MALLLLALSSRAAYLDPGRTAVINRAIELTIRERYPAALSLVDSLIRAEPARPEGWFFRAAILSMRMTDEESFRFANAMQADLDSAEVRVTRLQRGGREGPDLRFCQAGIHSYRAYHASRREQWLKALSHGLKGVRELEQVQERWPGFADARLGLGNYYFWRTVKLKGWLPLVPDERAEGIRLVESARHEGEYHSWVAASNLAWMYLEDGRPSQALALCREALARFPDSRLFLFPLGDALIDLQRWPEARDTWLAVLGRLEGTHPDSGVNRTICHGKLARIARETGNRAEAMRQARLALSVPVAPGMEFRVSDLRHTLEELLENGGR